MVRVLRWGLENGSEGLLGVPDAGAFGLLADIVDHRVTRDYVRNVLGPVRAYDKKHATQFFPTLQSLVRNGGRPQAAAGETGVHITTIRYRIDRLRELFGLNLRDSDVRFQLDLALRLDALLPAEVELSSGQHDSLESYQSWLLFFRPNNERRSRGIAVINANGVYALRGIMIIDWHTNLKMPEFASNEAEFNSRTLPAHAGDPNSFDEHVADTAEQFVIITLNFPRLGQSVPNEFVAEHVRRHRGRAIGLACVDPYEPKAPQKLEHAIRELGLRGLKCSPVYGGFDPWCPEAWALYEVCNRLKVPILGTSPPPMRNMPCMNMAIRPSSIGSPAPIRT